MVSHILRQCDVFNSNDKHDSEYPILFTTLRPTVNLLKYYFARKISILRTRGLCVD